MPRALRLQGVTLETRDLEASERFYRWSFRLGPAAAPGEPGSGRTEDAPASHGASAQAVSGKAAVALGWGGEDRLRLAHAGLGGDSSAREGEDAGEGCDSLTFRLEATPLPEALAWCAAAGLRVEGVAAAPADAEEACRSAPEVPVAVLQDPGWSNVSLVAVRGWAGVHLELLFPVPGRLLAERGQSGPFIFSTGDRSALENPGLLGTTWGGRDVGRGREFCDLLGIRPLEDAPAGATHLRVGDQQLILEEDERPGIRGLALVVPEASIDEVRRTVEHLGAEFRQSGSRLVTRDPDGRVVFVQGSRTA